MIGNIMMTIKSECSSLKKKRQKRKNPGDYVERFAKSDETSHTEQDDKLAIFGVIFE